MFGTYFYGKLFLKLLGLFLTYVVVFVVGFILGAWIF